MTELSDLPLLSSGKVREMYDMGDRLLMVASDRISTYDAVHPTLIPDKGKVLTGLSDFWFDRTGHIVPNHRLSATDDVRTSPSTRFAYGSAQPQTTRPSQSMTAMVCGHEQVKRVAR